MEPLTLAILEELKIALKSFGTYTFDDKGPMEVMGMKGHAISLRDMPAEGAAMVIFELARSKKHSGRPMAVASDLVSMLDDWDELCDIPGILDVMDRQDPGKGCFEGLLALK